MKRLFKTDCNETSLNVALLILRLGIGALMLVHGLPKLENLLSGNIQFAEVFGMSAAVGLTLTVFAEVVCSALTMLGLWTRLAVIPLAFTMMVAVFHIHATDPFSSQEMGLHYLLVYIVLFLMGSGKYSLDAAFLKSKK